MRVSVMTNVISPGKFYNFPDTYDRACEGSAYFFSLFNAPTEWFRTSYRRTRITTIGCLIRLNACMGELVSTSFN